MEAGSDPSWNLPYFSMFDTGALDDAVRSRRVSPDRDDAYGIRAVAADMFEDPNPAGRSDAPGRAEYGAMKPTTREQLRRAAVQAVETCPGIEAVVLFGSRARGTARTRSDWDVAVLSRANAVAERKACALVGDLERVNPIVLRPESIEEHRDQAARTEAAIARQGQLLAGTWTRPECRLEHLEVTPEDFQRDLEIAIRDVENAVTQLCNAALDNDVYVPNAVELSQQAAEATAKSIIAGHGLTAVSTHELNKLATQLRNAYRRRAGRDTRRLMEKL